MLSLADVRRYGELYWGDRPRDHAWTVPLDTSHYEGLPPTLAIGVEHDPLRDDARVFAERIRAAGGQAHAPVGVGLVHGSWRALATSPGVQWMHREVCRFLAGHAVD